MKIKIEYNSAYSYLKNPPIKLEQILSNSLRFTDKSIELANKKANGKYFKNAIVNLYNKKNHSFPTGLLRKVITLIKSRGLGYEVECIKLTKTIKPSVIDLETIQPFPDSYLWEHQKEAVQAALREKRCIVQMPTGSGKSITMATLIKHFPNSKIIITAPEHSIVKNNAKTIENIVGEEVGIVGGGKRDYKRITCSTVKSLYLDLKENPKSFKDVGVHLIDECHSTGNNKTSYFINKNLASVDYRIGFSATAWREGGDTLAMEALIGPIVYEVSEEELQSKNILVKFNYYTIKIPNDLSIKYSDYDLAKKVYNTYNKKPDRLEIYNKMVTRNEERNLQIYKLMKSYLNSEFKYGPVLILTESLEHAGILYRNLSPLLKEEEIEYVDGKTKEKERYRIIKGLRDSSIKCVISTKVFNVGVDFPAVGYLINAAGGNAKGVIIQKLGRVIRKDKTKQEALVVDFEDLEPYYLHSNFLNRVNAVKQRYPNTLIENKTTDEIIKTYY